ncbi:MAG TPA: lysylphosphatidylglycerol synthase transmembrane domain-containing protein, partial [Acidimicrobiales bacterium]|nr:lysylphosphatidylglycerol synthase transmembrane domain-containing protein [Acidimicrobiales bacterium]
QFANAFTGLVGGTAGNATLVIRFFQKQGLAPAVAVSSGILNSVSGFVVQVVLITIGLAVTGSSFDLSLGGDGIPAWMVAVAIAVVLAVAIVLLVPALRRRLRAVVEAQLRAAWDNVRGILATPRKAVQLFGGNLASQVLYAMVLGAALHAYGGSLPLLQLIVINCVASFVGGAAPVPGGMGVVEAGLIAGFTAAGVPEGEAVAATFTARACTSYLPPIWGWFALSWLRKKDYV